MTKIKIAFALFLFASSAFADTYVHGYYRKNGTYVQGHHRSSPNNTTLDNYSTRGNINPYTGKVGTKDPYSSNSGSNNDFENDSGSRWGD